MFFKPLIPAPGLNVVEKKLHGDRERDARLVHDRIRIIVMYPIFHVQETTFDTHIINRNGMPPKICTASNDIFVNSPRRAMVISSESESNKIPT